MVIESLPISAAAQVKFASDEDISPPDEETAKAAREKLIPKLEGFIKNIERILEENGGEWLVGKEFTWADLYVSVALDQVTFGAI